MNNLIPSELYITEASESKDRTQKELEIKDPEKGNLENIIAENAVSIQCDGRSS